MEAAADWYEYQTSSSREDAAYFADGVINAYLARMAEAGWVMGRDCGEADSRTTPMASPGQGQDVEMAWERGYEDGWNACRAAMLGRDDPPRADGEG